MTHLHYARPVAAVPEWLVGKLATSTELSDQEDEFYTRLCGVAPGYPEVFASVEARDAALGPFGTYVKFVPATWTAADAGDFPMSSVAIGHAIGDTAFDEVAPAILDAVARSLRDDDSHDIIIHRIRYIVRRLTDGAVKTYGWTAEFDGDAIEVKDALETLAYLDRELNQRLHGSAD